MNETTENGRDAQTKVWTPEPFLVPTLRVGMPARTLRVLQSKYRLINKIRRHPT